ncbi:MAG: histidine phosphatase family protein [Sarcina sp.]
MRVILLRHTESEANFNKVYGGKKDFKLTLNGEKQVCGLVEILSKEYGLKEMEKVRLISSPLSRAKYFADEIGRVIKKETEVVLELQEFDFGIFEGYSFEELKDKEEFKAWCNDYFNYEIPKGESLVVLKKRIEGFLSENLENSEEDFIIVSHEGVMKIIMLYLLKLPLENFWNFYCGNGSIVEIIYENGFGYLKQLYN